MTTYWGSRDGVQASGRCGTGLNPGVRGQRPVDRRLTPACQVAIGGGEMRSAEEAAVGRQRRRMHGIQHAVPARVDQLALALRVRAPQQEYQAFALAVERVDGCIGETLPTPVRMRAGVPFL